MEVFLLETCTLPLGLVAWLIPSPKFSEFELLHNNGFTVTLPDVQESFFFE